MYQVLHSPPGAGAVFALGWTHHGGGFGIEQDCVPSQDVFIGIRRGADITCLPFFKESASAKLASYTGEAGTAPELRVYSPDEIRHTLEYGSNRYETPELSFCLFSPVRTLPDPEHAGPEALREAFVPAITARLTIDNRRFNTEAEGIFAVSPMPAKEPLSAKTGGTLSGYISREGYGFAADGRENGTEFCDFGLAQAYARARKLPFQIAPMGALSFTVPAGEKRDITIALGWYRAGIAAAGLRECRYYYTRCFSGLPGVLEFALGHAAAWERLAQAQNDALPDMDENRRFLICQSAHCYYYSSMLFDDGGRPRWVVNEGTFRMMNTFDLFIDHAFFELSYHPWAVRNQLDSYLDDYSYRDQCGLSFTHDQGIQNVFAPRGFSGYEQPTLDGCFSYMTQEQLCNWVIIAAMYVRRSGDRDWAVRNRSVFAECLSSMLNRDSLSGDYTGVMRVDSSRCEGGAEITTYDSLDPSLGQARENLYLAVKCWASYLALQTLLEGCGGLEDAQRAEEAALRAARTIADAFDPALGYIPALLDGSNTTAIIPAIEALAYPPRFGRSGAAAPDGPYAPLAAALKRHAETVLKGPCLFPDGGWKLSAGNINSWMSKIFICEYVAESILRIPHDYACADRVHADWWRTGCPSNPGIDQIYNGTQTETGFHYPRCVSSELWRDVPQR